MKHLGAEKSRKHLGAEKSRKRLGAKKSRKEKEEVEVMDQEVWKELPEEILEVVIARLPIFTLNRYRLVCQKWNSLLKSPRFQQLWESFAQPLFFSVDVEDNYGNAGALYDPSMKEWRYSNHAPPSTYRGLLTAASAGGLVCFYHRFRGSFWVGNYLTQTWKTVPWSPRVCEVAVGMVNLNQDYSQHSTRGYKIIGLDSCGDYLVYDSIKDSTSTQRVPANIKLHFEGFGMRSVSIDTVVYFLAMKPDGLISYDTANGAWEQFSIPAPPNSYNVSPAECGGRILLVGELRNEYSPSFSICVWELEAATLHWKEVDRMPGTWCWHGPEDPWFYCLGNRRVLMVSLSSYCRSLIIMYDVVSREWSKAPLFAKPPRRRFPHLSNAVGFFPCLSASP